MLLAFLLTWALGGLAAPAQKNLPAPPSSGVAQCDRVAWEITHGHYERALAALSGMPTAGRTEAEQANLRGLAQMLSGQTAKAFESFDLAIQLQPAFPEARFNRAVTSMRSGDYTRASRDLQALATEDGTPAFRAKAAYHAALAQDALGDRAGATSWVTRALENDPELDDAILFSAVLAERRGALQEAGKGYKAYLARHPDSLVGSLRFGITAMRAGYVDPAKKYLHLVIDTAPDSAEAVEARKFLAMWE